MALPSAFLYVVGTYTVVLAEWRILGWEWGLGPVSKPQEEVWGPSCVQGQKGEFQEGAELEGWKGPGTPFWRGQQVASSEAAVVVGWLVFLL